MLPVPGPGRSGLNAASAAGVDVTYTRWPRVWHDFALETGLLAAADSALAQASWFVGQVTKRAEQH
jgi:acetyl esterase/lipase